LKAEDWRQLGKALQDNADLLETLAGADDTGISEPESLGRTLAWLLSKGLIDCDEHTLHIGSLLLDIGAQVSMQGFERAAPDLQEALISIQQHCEGYLSAKRDNASEDMDRHLKRLNHTTRQITHHLRDEYLSTRHFIEGGIGYANRPGERLRDIHNAIERLQRLHQKVLMFSYLDLSRLAQGDRTITRLLVGTQSTSLHASIQRRRTDFTGLIDRLDTLSLSVRKRNRFRQVMQAIESHLLAGNSLDLLALADNPDNTQHIPAPSMPVGGHVPTPRHAGLQVEAIEQFMASLPPPTAKRSQHGAVDDKPSVVSAVPVKASTKDSMESPFARDHLKVMLGALVESGQPQSAVTYWLKHGNPSIEPRLWLYALDYYVQLQSALAAKQGKRLHYCLTPDHVAFAKGSANRVIQDLYLERSQAVGG
tara:strand:+ start:135 stop:1403 length:1269 start_codon:yes stop_codon:yes gene_type:complete